MNVNVARGFYGVGAGKTNLKQKWEEIGQGLDSLGRPMRLGSEWQKVGVYFSFEYY